MSGAAARSATLAATKQPEVLSPFWSSIGGRVASIAAFTVFAAVHELPAWPAVALVLLLLSLLPERRRQILLVASLGVVAVAPPIEVGVLAALAPSRGAEAWLWAWPLVALAVLAFGCVFVRAVEARPKSALGRRPVLALVALLTLLLACAGLASLRGATWFFTTASAMALGSYLWFFAYAASDSRRGGSPPAEQQIGYWRPFWGFSNVPIGKGAAYLERVEARDAAALAAAQRSGLRLMAWCALLTVAMFAIRWLFYFPLEPGSLRASLLPWLPAQGLPPLAAALDAQARGEPFPLGIRWASMLGEFVLTVLHMTSWGNAIVATARMAGYAIALNTDRPLLSTSIADFYNRFYFYFKELLASFFFYPAYLRFFRSQPQLRLAFATFAAAGFGNFLFHFYRDSEGIFRLGFVDALVAYHVYGVYALLLGSSIAVSQLRLQKRGRKAAMPASQRAFAIFVVVSWYCLLGVLDVRSPHDIGVYAGFYASLLLP